MSRRLSAVLIVSASLLLADCGSDTTRRGTADADCTGGFCSNEKCVACRTADDCAQGYSCQAGACAQEQVDTCDGDVTCNNHGACVDTGGVISCTCGLGYDGDRCDRCAALFTDYGDGRCRPVFPCTGDTACAAEQRECVNNQGVAACGDCVAGFHEDAGSVCVVDSDCRPTTCSGHGLCDDTSGTPVCGCNAEYTGDNCESCATGYVEWPAQSGVCVDDPCDPDPCALPNAVPGGCVQTDVDASVCTCDPGYSWDGSACIPDGSCIDQDGDGCGTGGACVCADCDDSDPDVYEGAPEICDGKDNDCNLATDEGVVPLTPSCEVTNPWGTCSDNWFCDGASGWSCPAQAPEADICDYLDNNCDGQTDEPFRDGGGSPYDGGPFSADAGKYEGEACGTGVCAGGLVVCDAAGVGLTCSTLGNASGEVCDGTDNDCNGLIDDGC